LSSDDQISVTRPSVYRATKCCLRGSPVATAREMAATGPRNNLEELRRRFSSAPLAHQPSKVALAKSQSSANASLLWPAAVHGLTASAQGFSFREDPTPSSSARSVTPRSNQPEKRRAATAGIMEGGRGKDKISIVADEDSAYWSGSNDLRDINMLQLDKPAAIPPFRAATSTPAICTAAAAGPVDLKELAALNATLARQKAFKSKVATDLCDVNTFGTCESGYTAAERGLLQSSLCAYVLLLHNAF
jgi:hypothetical protein